MDVNHSQWSGLIAELAIDFVQQCLKVIKIQEFWDASKIGYFYGRVLESEKLEFLSTFWLLPSNCVPLRGWYFSTRNKKTERDARSRIFLGSEKWVSEVNLSHPYRSFSSSFYPEFESDALISHLISCAGSEISLKRECQRKKRPHSVKALSQKLNTQWLI